MRILYYILMYKHKFIFFLSWIVTDCDCSWFGLWCFTIGCGCMVSHAFGISQNPLLKEGRRPRTVSHKSIKILIDAVCEDAVPLAFTQWSFLCCYSSWMLAKAKTGNTQSIKACLVLHLRHTIYAECLCEAQTEWLRNDNLDIEKRWVNNIEEKTSDKVLQTDFFACLSKNMLTNVGLCF